MFEKYLKYIKTIRTKNTYEQYKRALELFEGKPATMETALEIVNRDDLSTNTKKQYLNVWTMALSFEGKADKKLIALTKSLKPEEKISAVPTKEEVYKCINSAKNAQFRLVIALMAFAGLRVGEVVKIKLQDIEDDKFFLRETKTHMQRAAVISSSLKPYLDEWLDDKNRNPGAYLFTNPKGGIYTEGYFKEQVKRACKVAGYGQFHCHSFRHFFATTIFKASGNNLVLTANACGHKSVATTKRYIRVETGDILAAANMF